MALHRGAGEAPSSSSTNFSKALAFYQQGRLDESQSLCRGVLRVHPNHFDARHLLGVIHLQRGQLPAAERLFAAALRINPNVAVTHLSLGIVLMQLARPAEALACFDHGLRLAPNDLSTLVNRGAALHALGRHAEAVAAYDKAIAARPDVANLYVNRGHSLTELKRFEDALKDLDRAVMLAPSMPEAWNNRGLALYGLKRNDEALADAEKALALRFDYAEAHNNRGNALVQLRRLSESLSSYDQAIALRPDYGRAICNRGHALLEMMRIDEALPDIERAIAVDPSDYYAIYNRALCHFLRGQLREGFADYESRWGMKWSKRPEPFWEGEPIEGLRLAVHSEQALGDGIQFSRYLPLLVERGADVTFVVRPSLKRVLAKVTAGTRVVTAFDESEAFDFQTSLMSLPFVLKTDLASVPNCTPYLEAEPELVAQWRSRIGQDGFRIGIAWQCNPQGDTGRAVPLIRFSPLARLPNVRLIALQKKDGLDQLAAVGPEFGVEVLDVLDEGVDAFVDTAAVIESLDLVIACDTSVAHLAGALGKETWLALKHLPEWRWMVDRDDSPWYPSMRLFRQTTDGDWTGAFAEIEARLRTRLTERGFI
jgi:tetratricopeptide (TPR) repeat protein